MRLVVPARAISFFGDSLAMVVLSLKVAELQRPVLMTLLLIAFSLPLFAMSPISGRLVDEHDSRTVLAVAGTVQVVASLGLVLSPSVWSILGFVVLLQVGQSVTAPAWAALVPRIVGDDQVGKAIGVQQSLAGMTGLAGAAVAGVLYDLVGYSATLLLDTATFAGLVVVALAVRTRRGRRYDLATSGQQVPDEPRPSGWQTIRRDPLLRLLVPALWLFVLSAEATNVVEVFLIRDDLGATAAVYGLATAAFLLGSIAGPLVAARVTSDRGRVSWSAAAAAAIGVLCAAIGLSPSVWVALPMFVGVGVAGGALNALIGTVMITRAAERVRGQVLATLNGTTRGFSVLALVLGGLAGQLVGPRGTFVICGALSVVVALIVLRTRREAELIMPAPALEPATMKA
jgi:MFS family permease